MLLVIFGAGASYDSSPDYPATRELRDYPADLARKLYEHRPPLANELFHNRPAFRERMAAFSQCLELVPYLIDKEINLEAELQQIEQKKDKHPRYAGLLTAIRYYLRQIIWDVEGEWEKHHGQATNYLTLLGQIDDWRVEQNEQVCFVTFNYDKMFERALRQTGIIFQELGNYISRDDYKLIKIHGSVDWAHPTIDFIREGRRNETTELQDVITSASQGTLRVNPEFSVVGRPLVRYQETSNGVVVRSWFPALAIPVVSKSEFECPKDHVESLKRVLKRVNRIVTIGWKGTEKKFLSLVREHLSVHSNILNVAGNPGEATLVGTTMVNNGIAGNYRVFDGQGFTSFVKSRQMNKFLETDAPPVTHLLGI